jgi:DNA-directed RNA polymerase specialized sigma24 family protein
MTTYKPLRKFDRGGRSIREVAQIMGVNAVTVAKYTSDPREEYLARAQSRREQIQAAYLSGRYKTLQEIANAMDCSLSTVNRAIRPIRHQKDKRSLDKKFEDFLGAPKI